MRHLHKPVHGPEEADVLHRGLDGREHDHHEHQGGAGDAGRGHGGCGRGQPGNRNREMILKKRYFISLIARVLTQQ